jgi:hypothetical protein
MRRPIGIIVIAVYCILSGLMIVLQSFQLVALEGIELRYQLFGAAYFALGTFELIAAYGLVVLASWGRVLAIIVFAVAIVLAIVSQLTADGITTLRIAFQLVGIVTAGAIIWYLQRPRIRALFADAASATAPRP